MIFEGNTTVSHAAVAVAAEADKGQTEEVPRGAGPEKPDAPDKLTSATASDKLFDALQKPVQAWRLLSAQRKTEIRRLTHPVRPQRTAPTKKVRCE